MTSSACFKIGDIFVSDYCWFFQVVNATAKTVTVRPIENRMTKILDRWETLHEPVQGAFCEFAFWPHNVAERGKRCKVRADGYGSGIPTIKVAGGIYATIWDGSPAILDRYN